VLVLAAGPGTKLMTPGRFCDGLGLPALAERVGPVMEEMVRRSASVLATQMLLVAVLVDVTDQKFVFQLRKAGVWPKTKLPAPPRIVAKAKRMKNFLRKNSKIN